MSLSAYIRIAFEMASSLGRRLTLSYALAGILRYDAKYNEMNGAARQRYLKQPGLLGIA